MRFHRARCLLVILTSLSVAACAKKQPELPSGPLKLTPVIAGAQAVPGTPPASIAIPSPPKVEAKGYILIDYLTGQVLAASNDNERLEPASLTKLMTSYVVFKALKEGRIKLTDMVTISKSARDQNGSRMFIEVGTQVSVNDLITGMIVQSGNDATVALAEHVAGSESVFVELMNKYAVGLGMTATHFEDTSGMPSAQHYTTAHDIAYVSAALIREFPEYYHWFSQREFTWNGIRQPNRNGLLERDSTVDGLKTGHTDAAGYCLVSSAKRENMRLVSVVMGSPSIHAREDASSALLNYGFRFYDTQTLFAKDKPLASIRVWQGVAKEVALGLNTDITLTLPRGLSGGVEATLDVPRSLNAPLDHKTAVTQLRVMQGDKEIAKRDVYPLSDVAASGFFSRLSDSIKQKFQ
jgi:D-alanyl-D-alanine carboxypeptidase (penicillin-binding protein 5/6)